MKRTFSLLLSISVVLAVHAVSLQLTSGDSLALDPNYRYAEPTIVMAPADTALEDKENYAFVSNNIRVSVDKGEVEDGLFSVKSGGSLSLTATRRIKGISIEGLVKKNFTAWADKGHLTALYAEEETEAEPVLVVTDVNDTTFTISCDKKLSCRSINVYFYANPRETVHGRTAPGDTVVVDCSRAAAVHTERPEYNWELDSVIVYHDYQLFLSYSNGYDSIYTFSLRFTADEAQISGLYMSSKGNLYPETSFCTYGALPTDFSMGVDGVLEIYSYAGQYYVSGYLICKNNNFYYFQYIGAIDFGGDTQAVEQTGSPVLGGQSFDLLGRPVGDEYKGIIIRDGKKFLIH